MTKKYSAHDDGIVSNLTTAERELFWEYYGRSVAEVYGLSHILILRYSHDFHVVYICNRQQAGDIIAFEKSFVVHSIDVTTTRPPLAHVATKT